MLKDYYEILGLQKEGCTAQAILQSYQEQRARYETGCVTAEDRDRYADILEAYLVLANAGIRKLYDEGYVRAHTTTEGDGSVPDTDPNPLLVRYILNAQEKAARHASKVKSPSQRKRIRKPKIVSAVFAAVVVGLLILWSQMAYVPFYSRSESCFLNTTSLKGDVLKVEMITSSTIPFTEICSENDDIHSEVDMLSSNTTVDLDGHGNVRRYRGYSLNGDILFNTTVFNNSSEGRFTSPSGYVPASYEVTSVKWKHRGRRVTEGEFYSGSKKVLGKFARYDSKGNISQIIRKFYMLEKYQEQGLLNTQDTTFYSYLEFDSHGNWTLARVEYHGVMDIHDYSFMVKRQITYNGEFRKTQLIRQLEDFIAENNPVDLPVMSTLSTMYFTMDIPANFEDRSAQDNAAIQASVAKLGQMDILANYKSKTGLPQANIFIDCYDCGEEIYSLDGNLNEPFDASLNEQLRAGIAKTQDLLYWEPYEFVDVSGKTMLKQSYFAKVNGDPLPVHFVLYTVPVGGGRVLEVSFGNTSKATMQWNAVFEKVLSSITWKF